MPGIFIDSAFMAWQDAVPMPEQPEKHFQLYFWRSTAKVSSSHQCVLVGMALEEFCQKLEDLLIESFADEDDESEMEVIIPSFSPSASPSNGSDGGALEPVPESTQFFEFFRDNNLCEHAGLVFHLSVPANVQNAFRKKLTKLFLSLDAEVSRVLAD